MSTSSFDAMITKDYLESASKEKTLSIQNQ